MSTIIRGGSITVDGLAPSGQSGNNPVVDNLTVNNNATVGGTVTASGLELAGNAGYHNSIHRGKNLGSSVTAAQWAQIKAGTFNDMFVGDYWVIDNRIWRIADFDYWFNCGDTATNAHHLVIVPDTVLSTGAMNSTDTTTGAYMGSNFYTGANGNTRFADITSIIETAFGAAHILNHRELLTNAISGNESSGWAWVDNKIILMNETMVYGTKVWGTAGYDIGVDKKQLSLFTKRADLIIAKNSNGNHLTWWLRSIMSSDSFAVVNNGGNASRYSASNSSLGIRPAFAIYQAAS